MDERGKEILAMVQELETERRLTQWEQSFIEDISDKFLGQFKNLTQGQYEKLRSIHKKYNN